MQTISFQHEIARSRGYERNDDKSYKKDKNGNRIQVIVRPDLPMAAKDRQFTLTVTNVPDGFSARGVEELVKRYIYGHKSFIDCTLFDHSKLKHGDVVTFNWNDINTWLDRERTKGGNGQALKNHKELAKLIKQVALSGHATETESKRLAELQPSFAIDTDVQYDLLGYQKMVVAARYHAKLMTKDQYNTMLKQIDAAIAKRNQELFTLK